MVVNCSGCGLGMRLAAGTVSPGAHVRCPRCGLKQLVFGLGAVAGPADPTLIPEDDGVDVVETGHDLVPIEEVAPVSVFGAPAADDLAQRGSYAVAPGSSPPSAGASNRRLGLVFLVMFAVGLGLLGAGVMVWLSRGDAGSVPRVGLEAPPAPVSTGEIVVEPAIRPEAPAPKAVAVPKAAPVPKVVPRPVPVAEPEPARTPRKRIELER